MTSPALCLPQSDPLPPYRLWRCTRIDWWDRFLPNLVVCWVLVRLLGDVWRLDTSLAKPFSPLSFFAPRNVVFWWKLHEWASSRKCLCFEGSPIGWIHCGLPLSNGQSTRRNHLQYPRLLHWMLVIVISPSKWLSNSTQWHTRSIAEARLLADNT